MDIEQLIESVRSRKILYVTTSKLYKNSSKKEAWWHVADEVGEGVAGRLQAHLAAHHSFMLSSSVLVSLPKILINAAAARTTSVSHLPPFYQYLCISFAYLLSSDDVVRHRTTSFDFVRHRSDRTKSSDVGRRRPT